MDTQRTYQKTAKQRLQTYADFLADEDDNLRLLFDDERGSYALLDFGWRDKRYDHYAILQVDIIQDKVWIQCDHTENGVALELAEMGIPKDKIVLGRLPELRPHMGFGV